MARVDVHLQPFPGQLIRESDERPRASGCRGRAFGHRHREIAQRAIFEDRSVAL